jgi:hypothetical protein
MVSKPVSGAGPAGDQPHEVLGFRLRASRGAPFAVTRVSGFETISSHFRFRTAVCSLWRVHMGDQRSLFHVGQSTGCLCLAIAFTMDPVSLSRSPAPSSDARAAAAMQGFLDRTTAAHQYSAARRLEASGCGHQGWLDVQTEFTVTSGLLYQVTAEGGSGYIRSRVLRSLLDDEQSLIARNGSASVAISPDNYQLTPEGLNEEGLAVVRMQPLRKDRALIAGRMFLTVEGEIVRVVGRLAKNPSFWVSQVSIVRSYRRINGVSMPVSLETTAQLRLLGSSALRMTYRYAQVDERIVVDEPQQ